MLFRVFTSRPVRFLIVGCLGSAVWYGVYALMIALGAHFTIANLLAVVVAVLFSFKTQGRFVFGQTGNTGLVRFIVSRIVLYFTSVLMIKGLIMAGFNAYAAGAIATPVMAVLSYAMQRYFVFQTPA